MLAARWTQIEWTFLLLVYFQFKQFFADFPLQGEYMLKKSQAGWGFLLPLLVHCLVHAALSAIVILVVAPHLWWLIGFDFLVHFVMDRIKSGPRYLGRFSDKEMPSYWNCFGFDQMVHHLTHIYIIWAIVNSF